MLEQPIVTSEFLEEELKWLAQHRIIYSKEDYRIIRKYIMDRIAIVKKEEEKKAKVNVIVQEARRSKQRERD